MTTVPSVRPVLSVAVAVLVAAWAGCSRPTRIDGLVTLDGQPLPGAIVQFFPTGAEGRTAATTTDANGRYATEVSPHPMRAVIRAQKVVGQVKDGESMVDAVTELVPERYRNPGSALLTVEPQAGSVTTADFALTSAKD